MRNICILVIICLAIEPSLVFAREFTIEETSFKNSSLLLFADIYVPQKASTTGIVLIQGSGNSDRTNLWSKSFAELLASQGYYVLHPDKRGCGKSEGDWKKASFADLSTDAIASVRHLKQKMKLKKVGVMGLSQGGFIAPIAASTDPSIDFVIDVVGAAVKLEEQIIHEVANTAKKEGLAPNEIREVLELHVLMKQYAFDKNWQPLEEKFKQLSTSRWANFAKTFPDQPDVWVWEWVKLNINYNPINYWKQVKQDVFVAYGAKDQEDNMPVYESVYRLQNAFSAAGKKNYEINLYDAGHALYKEDKAELRTEFTTDLVNWLHKRQ